MSSHLNSNINNDKEEFTTVGDNGEEINVVRPYTCDINVNKFSIILYYLGMRKKVYFINRIS
jgi:hypothetical protein